MNPKRSTPRHIIKMPKVKDKETILKAARLTYKGVPIILLVDFLKETWTGKKGLARSTPK